MAPPLCRTVNRSSSWPAAPAWCPPTACSPPPPDAPPRPTGWAHSRAQLAALLLAFTLGAAVVVLLAVSTDPRRHAPAAGLDCDAPAADLPTLHSPRVTA